MENKKIVDVLKKCKDALEDSDLRVSLKWVGQYKGLAKQIDKAIHEMRNKSDEGYKILQSIIESLEKFKGCSVREFDNFYKKEKLTFDCSDKGFRDQLKTELERLGFRFGKEDANYRETLELYGHLEHGEQTISCCLQENGFFGNLFYVKLDLRNNNK